MVKRVFVVWKHSLFQQSVCRLLVGPALDVVGDAQDAAMAEVAIGALEPDVVIVETTGDPAGCVDVLGLTQRHGWNCRLICASLDDNMILSLHQEQHLVTTAQELLHLVLDE